MTRQHSQLFWENLKYLSCLDSPFLPNSNISGVLCCGSVWEYKINNTCGGREESCALVAEGEEFSQLLHLPLCTTWCSWTSLERSGQRQIQRQKQRQRHLPLCTTWCSWTSLERGGQSTSSNFLIPPLSWLVATYCHWSSERKPGFVRLVFLSQLLFLTRCGNWLQEDGHF